MASPREPDAMVSISIERSFLPSFITEPLPNWRSIWDSAAERALDLSMEDPSTIRRAVADIGRCSLWRGFLCGAKRRARSGKTRAKGNLFTLFFFLSLYFFFILL